MRKTRLEKYLEILETYLILLSYKAVAKELDISNWMANKGVNEGMSHLGRVFHSEQMRGFHPIYGTPMDRVWRAPKQNIEFLTDLIAQYRNNRVIGDKNDNRLISELTVSEFMDLFKTNKLI